MQLDSFDPEKFLEVGERARVAEENVEKAKEEITRLTRLVKEWVPCALCVLLLRVEFTRCFMFERAEKTAEEEKKEDPTILR